MTKKNKDKIIAELLSEISALKSVLYKIPGSIYWKTKDDVFLGCNQNLADILGLNSPDEIVGKRGVDLMPPELAKMTRTIDLEVLKLKKEKTYEETGFNAKGQKAIYLSHKSPFYDDQNKLSGVIGISVDITQQKILEKKLKLAKQKAEVSNRAKSQFIALASHELRIPLTCILGFSQFLQEAHLSLKERRDYIDQLVRAGNYLLALINNILDYSKLEAKKANLSPCSIDLQELIEDVIVMSKGAVQEKDLTLHLEYDNQMPESINTDPYVLKQILMNLVSNAIKFTKKGGITIKVMLLEQSAHLARVQITVKDSGIGIPKDKLKSIFKDFYQVDDIYRRSTSISGTGLGLAIVSKLVKLLNGTIEAKSKINHGSIFTFVAEFQIEHLTKPKIAEKQTTLSKTLSVLLIEDDPAVQFIHKKMLVDLGCRVDVATDGRSALTMANHSYQIIFVDLGLPDITGFELIEKLKKPKCSTAHTPIIVLTGFFSEEESKHSRQLGALEVLVKPVPPEILKDVLLKYV